MSLRLAFGIFLAIFCTTLLLAVVTAAKRLSAQANKAPARVSWRSLSAVSSRKTSVSKPRQTFVWRAEVSLRERQQESGRFGSATNRNSVPFHPGGLAPRCARPTGLAIKASANPLDRNHLAMQGIIAVFRPFGFRSIGLPETHRFQPCPSCPSPTPRLY